MKKLTAFLVLGLFIVLRAQGQAINDAVLKDDTALVVKLITEGKDVNAPDQNGTTPLMAACRWGKLNMVRILLQHGAKADEPRTAKGRTPLMVACAYYSGPDICGLLIKYGANVNAQANDGSTALMLAANNGKVAVVELLLNQKANAYAKDTKGSTALDYANRADLELIKNSMPDQKLSKEEVITLLKKATGQE